MIQLKKYGSVITDEKVGKQIFDDIKKELKKEQKIIIDFSEVETMATFCAKQIFGKLYVELKPEVFFDRIELTSTNKDLQIVIRWGILHAIEEQEKNNITI